MSDIKPFDYRVHIRGADGSIIRENHYALHIVNGNKYLNRPVGSDKFFTEGGHPIPLEEVPDVCKKHLAGGKAEATPVKTASSFLGKKPGKKGSESETDSLV